MMQFLPFNKISANISKFFFFQLFYAKKNCAPFWGAQQIIGYSGLFLHRSNPEFVVHLLLGDAILWQCAYIVSA